MADPREKALRAQIHPGMPVLGMDGGELGRVYSVGDHALALERGAFFPREWRASFAEVERVDELGVWLSHGWGTLEKISDAFCGPTDAYRPAVEASPIYRSTLFVPSATSEEEPAQPPADTDDPNRS